MKILIIPDVHGSHEWEAAKELPSDAYDYAAFLGDYFDCWENEWPDQGENFKAICDFVRQDTAHRKLLLGNHDWSYLSKTVNGAGVSGHQNRRIDEIRKLLTENHDILDLAFECDANCPGGRIVFAHAGFSRTWVKAVLKVFGISENQWSLSFLNKEWHRLSFDPHSEGFNYAFEELLDWYGFFSSSGNEITQGPLWIRPEALLKDAFYETQIVGHTECCLGDFVFLRDKDINLNRMNTVIAADSSSHLIFDVIDTENLPSEAISLLDFNKFYKGTQKQIYDIKSLQFSMADYSKERAMAALSAAFGEKLAERYYRMYF
ncbi:Calcineurin-like phosphoesterase [Treponema sp. JC4]|uniref:metallophosphoesterase n=1 Tax=Treponema sp. JC4 TaxID=1124982 RepID=UPI00025B05D3|nr:metallophosphoesterase [Treponema sp. JC4]EID84021.1 Calcineurin-like phosphoesterase [Treponema sp. JC4]